MTKAEVTTMLFKAKFKEAKTMKNIPHSYTLKKDWNNTEAFKEVVIFIRENGVVEKFYNKEYIYFYANKSKYWTMGSPIEKTILINKAKV